MDEKVRIIEKHHLVLRISHWLNFPLLSLMIWSGVLIYWANDVYVKVPDTLLGFRIHHRLAEGMGWHFFIMWLFVLNGIVYLTFLITSGHWKELIPTKATFKNLIQFLLYDFHIKKEAPPREGLYNPVQRIAYFGILLIGLGSIVTGLAIYKPVQLGWLTEALGGYEAARFEHFIFMIIFVLFIVIHVIQVIRAGWNNFRAMLAGYEIDED